MFRGIPDTKLQFAVEHKDENYRCKRSPCTYTGKTIIEKVPWEADIDVKELSSKVDLQEKEIKDLTRKMKLQEKEISSEGGKFQQERMIRESRMMKSSINSLSYRLTETQREVGRVRNQIDQILADRENVHAEIWRLKSAASIFFALLAIVYFLR